MHAIRNDEIGQFWFVAFDGGPEPMLGTEQGQGTPSAQACALLAKETEPNSYSGFLTYDPERVDALLEYIDETYS